MSAAGAGAVLPLDNASISAMRLIEFPLLVHENANPLSSSRART